MSNIENDNRDFNLRERILFIDTYEWEIDKEGNHRLIHRETERASAWVPSTVFSVLNDRIVFPEFFQGTGVPVKMMLKWEITYPVS